MPVPDNKVQLEVFEGPLDLLLYLVRKDEVNIYEVNLTRIASQFIEYVEVMRQLDLDIAGEFLVMASTLMFIKSKELLPVEQRAITDAEEDADDPRWELIRQLVEYKKFKDAAALLQDREEAQEHIFPRIPGKLQFDAPPPKPDVSIFDLINAVTSILKRFNKKEDSRDLFADRWTVSEKIELLAQTVKERGTVHFSELFAATTNRTEVVVTFLALLELIRLKQISVQQSEPFSEIQITAAAPTPPLPPSNPEPAPGLAPATSPDGPPVG